VNQGADSRIVDRYQLPLALHSASRLAPLVGCLTFPVLPGTTYLFPFLWLEYSIIIVIVK
jgi:hypothetical protein